MATLQLRHGNAYDTIIKVDQDSDGNPVVVSAWEAADNHLREFCDLTQDPDNWSDGAARDASAEFDDPDGYGELIATRTGHLIFVEDNDGAAFEARLRHAGLLPR